MVAKRWRITIAKTDDARSVQRLDVESSNWIAALRLARAHLGEDGAVPQGANCAVSDDGTVTVIEPGSSRQFIITSVGEPVVASSDAQTPGFKATRAKPKALMQTMAYTPNPSPMIVPHRSKVPTAAGPGHAEPPPQPPPIPAAPQTASKESTDSTQDATPPARPKRNRSATLAFEIGQHGNLIPGAEAKTPTVLPTTKEQVSASSSRTPATAVPANAAPLDVATLLARDEEPSRDNPLTYRERAYLVPEGVGVEDAERTLREKLHEIQGSIERSKKGKYIRLAVFDYRWSSIPSRPPLAVLEWRDWRGEPTVEYPGRVRTSTSAAKHSSGATQRLTALASEISALRECQTLFSALKLGLKLIVDTIPCEAASACLYDVSTHELRFVVVHGGNEKRQGTAFPASAGLLGRSLESDNAWLQVRPIQLVTYDKNVDSCGIDKVHSLLLRPLRYEGMPLGALQLVNRAGDAREFTHDDGQVADHIGDHLAAALHALKRRMPR